MSIHVCKCTNNGKEEFHLRYPGLMEEQAQNIADMINGGALDIYYRIKKEQQETVTHNIYINSDALKRAGYVKR